MLVISAFCQMLLPVLVLQYVLMGIVIVCVVPRLLELQNKNAQINKPAALLLVIALHLLRHVILMYIIPVYVVSVLK